MSPCTCARSYVQVLNSLLNVFLKPGAYCFYTHIHRSECLEQHYNITAARVILRQVWHDDSGAKFWECLKWLASTTIENASQRQSTHCILYNREDLPEREIQQHPSLSGHFKSLISLLPFIEPFHSIYFTYHWNSKE